MSFELFLNLTDHTFGNGAAANGVDDHKQIQQMEVDSLSSFTLCPPTALTFKYHNYPRESEGICFTGVGLCVCACDN